MYYAFCLTERLSFVQNLKLTSYVTLLNFLPLSWVFVDIFSIFQKESCFPRVPATCSSSFQYVFAPCSCAFTWFIYVCVFVLFSLTENKGRTLEITWDFLFSSHSFFPFLVCTCTCHVFPLSLSSSLAIFPNPLLQRGCGQRKCSSMGPSLGLMW